MNVTNILSLANAIEQEAFGFKFNQGVYCIPTDEHRMASARHLCGSTACMMGMAALLISEGNTFLISVYDRDFEAAQEAGKTLQQRDIREWLDIGDYTYDNLYYAQHRDYNRFPKMEDVPRDLAIRVLRHLAATGEVDWSV